MHTHTDKAILDTLKEYRMVKTWLENDERIERELETVLLRDGNYTDEDSGEKITDPDQSYTMSNDQYNEFLKLRYEHEQKLHIADPRGWQYGATQRDAERLHGIETWLIETALDVVERTNPSEAATLRAGYSRNYLIRQKVLAQALKLFDSAHKAAQTAQ